MSHPNPEGGGRGMADKAFWSRNFLRLGILIGALVVALSATLVFALVVPWRNKTDPGTAVVGAKLTDAAQDVERLKERLEAYEKRINELKELAAVLLGVSTIYGIALGLSSYFGMQQAVEQAKASAAQIETMRQQAVQQGQHFETKLEELLNKTEDKAAELILRIRSQFPFLGDMELAVDRITDHLINLLPHIDWSAEEQRYRDLSPEQKQDVLYYEKTVAALEFFDLRFLRRQASQIYHGLGNFYGLRYKLESKASDDRDRAGFYLERAVTENNRDAAALNDCGYFYLEVSVDLARARQRFELSLKVDPEQQRALYNLSIVEHSEKHYERSERLLTESLDKARWQECPRPDRRYNIFYNRACARVQLAEDPENRTRTAELHESALKDLQEAFPGGLEKAFHDDVGPGRDLYPLVIDAAYAGEMQQLIKRLK
jgi:hypothetical protein